MSVEDIMSNEIISNDIAIEQLEKAQEVLDMSKKKMIVRKKKVECGESFEVKMPGFAEYDYVNDKRLKVPDLKSMCKHYKLKVTGNKNQLQKRLYDYLYMSNNCFMLQAVFRRSLVGKWIDSHGPGLFDRTNVINTTDFATMEDVIDIPMDQVFSFKDSSIDKCYVFDVASFATLVKSSVNSGIASSKLKNPYTMSPIEKPILTQFKQLIKLSKTLKRQVDYEVKDEDENSSNQETLQLTTSQRITRLFQEIDTYGHYTSTEWLENMTALSLRQYIQEVIQIFQYRAHLSTVQRAQIIPPRGLIYSGNIRAWLITHPTREELLSQALEISERLVFTGINRDNRQLGCFYVLMALTLACQGARDAMPWLYEASMYNEQY